MANLTYPVNFTANYTSIQSTSFVDYNLLGNRIGTVIYSIIYALGFVGNFLALITFSDRRMRQISSSIFLLVLSISDTISLIASLWFFLADAFSIQLQNYSALGCRFRTFFAYVFMDLSSWCLAGLAFDRFLRTEIPLRAKRICIPRNALIMILIFFLLLCGINGHYFSAGIGQERSGNRTAHCLENREAYPNYYYFYKIIWPKIDMIVFCFLPACIMILCNVRIICILRRRRHNLENQGSTNEHVKVVNIEQTLNGSIYNKRSPPLRRKAIERQMSLMMSACVMVFLSTTVPVTIYLILLEQVIVKYPNFRRDNAYYVFIFRMLRSLMYVHFACNFYLYCLTSRIFRGEFIQTITCRRIILNTNQEPTSLILNKIVDISNI